MPAAKLTQRSACDRSSATGRSLRRLARRGRQLPRDEEHETALTCGRFEVRAVLLGRTGHLRRYDDLDLPGAVGNLAGADVAGVERTGRPLHVRARPTVLADAVVELEDPFRLEVYRPERDRRTFLQLHACQGNRGTLLDPGLLRR